MHQNRDLIPVVLGMLAFGALLAFAIQAYPISHGLPLVYAQ